METLKAISRLISVLFVLCYANQLVYIFVSLLSKRKRRRHSKTISLRKNRYAVLVCARQIIVGVLAVLRRGA